MSDNAEKAMKLTKKGKPDMRLKANNPSRSEHGRKAAKCFVAKRNAEKTIKAIAIKEFPTALGVLLEIEKDGSSKATKYLNTIYGDVRPSMSKEKP